MDTPASYHHPIGRNVLHRGIVLLSIPIVIPFKYLFWVSLESLYMELCYFTAFAKKASRIGRITPDSWQ